MGERQVYNESCTARNDNKETPNVTIRILNGSSRGRKYRTNASGFASSPLSKKSCPPYGTNEIKEKQTGKEKKRLDYLKKSKQ